MIKIITRRFTFTTVPRWSFGVWKDEGLVTIDIGCFCAEFINPSKFY